MMVLTAGLPPFTASAATKAEALKDGMHKLWENHITWIRLFIVSARAASLTRPRRHWLATVDQGRGRRYSRGANPLGAPGARFLQSHWREARLR